MHRSAVCSELFCSYCTAATQTPDSGAEQRDTSHGRLTVGLDAAQFVLVTYVVLCNATYLAKIKLSYSFLEFILYYLDLRYNYVKLKDRGCRRSILRG